jgi:hypothetical protein
MDSLKQLEKQIFLLKELVESFESKINTEEDLTIVLFNFNQKENLNLNF